VTFSALITPLREAGLHDTTSRSATTIDRDIFRTALRDRLPAAPPLASRHVSIVEGHAPTGSCSTRSTW